MAVWIFTIVWGIVEPEGLTFGLNADDLSASVPPTLAAYITVALPAAAGLWLGLGFPLRVYRVMPVSTTMLMGRMLGVVGLFHGAACLVIVPMAIMWGAWPVSTLAALLCLSFGVSILFGAGLMSRRVIICLPGIAGVVGWVTALVAFHLSSPEDHASLAGMVALSGITVTTVAMGPLWYVVTRVPQPLRFNGTWPATVPGQHGRWEEKERAG